MLAIQLDNQTSDYYYYYYYCYSPIVVSSPHHRETVVSPHLVRLKKESKTRWCRRLGGVDDGKKPGSQSWLPGMPSLARSGATPARSGVPRNGLNEGL